MILTVAGWKGGISKTTTAVHLACYFGLKHGNTLLVDGDPNRSAMNWSKRGDLPFEVCDLFQAPMLSQGRSHIVIDTEAHPDDNQIETLSKGCDLLVLPTSPNALAVEALLQTVKRLEAIANYRVLISMVDSRKKNTARQAREALEKVGVPLFKTQIRLLSAYEKASLMGVPVYASGDKFGKIAWREYEDLGKEIEALEHGEEDAR